MSDSDCLENLVEEHLRDRMFGAEMLAEWMKISPLQLRRLTQHAFGMTPGRFIDSRRMRRAVMLLCRNEHPHVVCRLAGFPCMSVFRRSFARCFHMTMVELQIKLRQMEQQESPAWESLLGPALGRFFEEKRGVS